MVVDRSGCEALRSTRRWELRGWIEGRSGVGEIGGVGSGLMMVYGTSRWVWDVGRTGEVYRLSSVGRSKVIPERSRSSGFIEASKAVMPWVARWAPKQR